MTSRTCAIRRKENYIRRTKRKGYGPPFLLRKLKTSPTSCFNTQLRPVMLYLHVLYEQHRYVHASYRRFADTINRRHFCKIMQSHKWIYCYILRLSYPTEHLFYFQLETKHRLCVGVVYARRVSGVIQSHTPEIAICVHSTCSSNCTPDQDFRNAHRSFLNSYLTLYIKYVDG